MGWWCGHIVKPFVAIFLWLKSQLPLLGSRSGCYPNPEELERFGNVTSTSSIYFSCCKHGRHLRPRIPYSMSTIPNFCGKFQVRISPPIESPKLLDYSLQVHTITASMFTRLWSPLAANHKRGVHLHVHSLWMWWNGEARWQKAHHQHPAAPCMASKANSSQWPVLAWVAFKTGEKMWRDTMQWLTTQIRWINKHLARVFLTMSWKRLNFNVI